MNIKILTYNINGIRAALKKNLIGFLKTENPDIVCFQELKANADQFDVSLFNNLGYFCYWFSAQKKGYSGVGILSKIKPLSVDYGCGDELFDFEGRVLKLNFSGWSVLSCYFPSGSSGYLRQEFKFRFLSCFMNYIEAIKKETPLIICGDYNICHKAIDIHNPKSNAKSSGFLPKEREWMTTFFESGFTDTFRKLNPNPNNYTWWSYRANARANNKGWRIDYISISTSLDSLLKEAKTLPNDKHSDHCASYAILDLSSIQKDP